MAKAKIGLDAQTFLLGIDAMIDKMDTLTKSINSNFASLDKNLNEVTDHLFAAMKGVTDTIEDAIQAYGRLGRAAKAVALKDLTPKQFTTSFAPAGKAGQQIEEINQILQGDLAGQKSLLDELTGKAGRLSITQGKDKLSILTQQHKAEKEIVDIQEVQNLSLQEGLDLLNKEATERERAERAAKKAADAETARQREWQKDAGLRAQAQKLDLKYEQDKLRLTKEQNNSLEGRAAALFKAVPNGFTTQDPNALAQAAIGRSTARDTFGVKSVGSTDLEAMAKLLNSVQRVRAEFKGLESEGNLASNVSKRANAVNAALEQGERLQQASILREAAAQETARANELVALRNNIIARLTIKQQEEAVIRKERDNEINFRIGVAAKAVELDNERKASAIAVEEAIAAKLRTSLAEASQLRGEALAKEQAAKEKQRQQILEANAKEIKLATDLHNSLLAEYAKFDAQITAQRKAAAKVRAENDFAEIEKARANANRSHALNSVQVGLGALRPTGSALALRPHAETIFDLDQQLEKFKNFVNRSAIEGKRLEAIFDGIRQGQNVVLNTKDEEKAYNALKKLADGYNNVTSAIRKTAEAEELRNGINKARQELEARNPTPAGTPAGAIAARSFAYINLEQVAAKNKIDGQRIIQIYDNVKNGIKLNMNSAEAAVAKAVKGIITSQDILTGKTKTFVGNLYELYSRLDKIVATRVLYTIISNFTQAFQQGFQSAVLYSNQLALIQTLTQDITASHKEWSNVLRDISDQFGGGLSDVAEAVYEGVSNQIVKTTTEAQYFAEAIGKVSLVARSSFDDAGKLVAGLINSYGVGIESTNQINAKLFRAMDLGKFKFSEIAEQMGRAAPTANELGVSMDELLAALSTLTVEGRRADVSLTLIRNIMVKLLKPTEGLQKTLEGFGYSSGRAAVQTEGLIGILQRLQSESPETLAEMFQDMRAIEGAVSLTGNSFARFNEYFHEIKDTSEGLFENAVNIVRTNPLKQLEIEGNKVRNFFTVDVATAVLEAFAQINTAIGGFTNTLDKVKRTFENSFGAGVLKGVVDVVAGIGDGLLNIVSGGNKAANAVNNLIYVLKVAGETYVALQAKVLLKSAYTSLVNLSTQWKEYVKSVRIGGEEIDHTGKVIVRSAGGISGAIKGIATSAAAVTAYITIVIALIEKIADSYEHLGEAQEKAFKKGEANRTKTIEGFKREGKALQDAYTDAFKGIGEQAAEFYAKLKTKADANLANVLDGEKAFQEGIKVTFEARIKKYEEFVKKIKNEVEATRGLIAQYDKDLAKIEAEGFDRVFNNMLDMAKVQDNFSRDSVKAEKDRLKDLVKELDKAVEESQKRVKSIATKNDEQRFGFAQKLKDSAQQYEGLVARATEQRKKAEEAIAAGKEEEASQLLADAAATKNEAEQNLQQRIEDAKKKGEDAAKDAIKKAEELSKLKKTPDNKRERDALIKDQAKARVDSKAAFDEAKRLQDVLNAQERERLGIIEAQTAAELRLQEAKKAEKEATEKQLADLTQKSLNFQAEADKLIQDRINKLFNLQTDAEKQGDFGRAIELLKEQDKLLENLRQTKVQRFEQAVQAKDLEAQKRALKDINFVLGEQGSVQNDLVTNYDNLKQAAAEQVKQLEKAAALEARNLLAIRGIAKEASKIQVIDSKGGLLNTETAAERLNYFDKRVKELVANGAKFGPKLNESLEEARANIINDVDEFGQAFNFKERIQAGLDVLKASVDELAKTRIIPFEVELKGLGVVAKTLDEAEGQIRNKLSEINKIKEDIGTRRATNQGDILTSGAQLQGSLGVLGATLNQEILAKLSADTEQSGVGLVGSAGAKIAASIFTGGALAPTLLPGIKLRAELEKNLKPVVEQAQNAIILARAKIVQGIKDKDPAFVDKAGNLLASAVDTQINAPFDALRNALKQVQKASVGGAFAPSTDKLEKVLEETKKNLLANAEAEAKLLQVEKDRASLDKDLIALQELRAAISRELATQNKLEAYSLDIQNQKITQLQAELSIRERIQQALTSGNPTPEAITQQGDIRIENATFQVTANNGRQLLQELDVAMRNDPKLAQAILQRAGK